jgi:hypothetical protein
MDRIVAFIVVGLLVVGVCGGGIAWYLGRSPAAAVTAAPESPARVVTAFYDAISREDFTTAWNLLSPTFQHDGSFDKFKDGYATTQSVSVSVGEVPGAPQKIRATLDATDLINGNSVHSHFEGWWILTKASGGRWLLDNGHFTKTQTDVATSSDTRTAVRTSDFSTPTEATPTPEATESTSGWFAATKAFHAMNASKQTNCQELAYLIETPEQRKTDPAFAHSPLQIVGLFLNRDDVLEAAVAIDAGKCLDDVRTETSDDLPAEYPIAYLRGACQKVRPNLASDQIKMFFANANIDAVEEVTKYCKSIHAWE